MRDQRSCPALNARHLCCVGRWHTLGTHHQHVPICVFLLRPVPRHNLLLLLPLLCLRFHRFDRELLFPMPDLAARRSILTIHSRHWTPPPAPALLDDLAQRTGGYCGADLRVR